MAGRTIGPLVRGWLDVIASPDPAIRGNLEVDELAEETWAMDQLTLAAAQRQGVDVVRISDGEEVDVRDRKALLSTFGVVPLPRNDADGAQAAARLVMSSPFFSLLVKLVILGSVRKGEAIDASSLAGTPYSTRTLKQAVALLPLMTAVRESNFGHYKYAGIAAKGLGQVIARWFVGYWGPQALWKKSGLEMNMLWPWPEPVSTKWGGSQAETAWANAVLLEPYSAKDGVNQARTSRSQVDAMLCMLSGFALTWASSTRVPKMVSGILAKYNVSNPLIRTFTGIEYAYHWGSLNDLSADQYNKLIVTNAKTGTGYQAGPALEKQCDLWAANADTIISALQGSL